MDLCLFCGSDLTGLAAHRCSQAQGLDMRRYLPVPLRSMVPALAPGYRAIGPLHPFRVKVPGLVDPIILLATSLDVLMLEHGALPA